jgi:hypothetical protein
MLPDPPWNIVLSDGTATDLFAVTVAEGSHIVLIVRSNGVVIGADGGSYGPAPQTACP